MSKLCIFLFCKKIIYQQEKKIPVFTAFKRTNLALIAVFIMLNFCACTENRKITQELRYFDLEQFFDGEIIRLNKQKSKAIKTVILNGESEVKQIQIDNWEAELSAFFQADINKPAYLGYYKIDTTTSQNQTHITYTALKTNLKTKELKLTYSNNQLIQFSAQLTTENVIYKSYQTLIYEPQIGYEIKGQQTVRFLNDDQFEVQVQFN